MERRKNRVTSTPGRLLMPIRNDAADTPTAIKAVWAGKGRRGKTRTGVPACIAALLALIWHSVCSSINANDHRGSKT
jgi:hypothetical protein